jgi:hypothetical protein
MQHKRIFFLTLASYVYIILCLHHLKHVKIFSSRTREAAERFFLRCDDMGDAIPTPKHFRKDPHVYGQGTHHTNDHHTSNRRQSREFSSIANAVMSLKRRVSFNKKDHPEQQEKTKPMKSSIERTDGGGGNTLEELSKPHEKQNKGTKKKQNQQQLIDERLGLDVSFQSFREGIKTNPHVNMAILRRRFALLTVLERGTQPDSAKFPNQSSGIVAVSWHTERNTDVQWIHFWDVLNL